MAKLPRSSGFATHLTEHEFDALVALGRKGIEAYAAEVKAATQKYQAENLEILRRAWKAAPATVDAPRYDRRADANHNAQVRQGTLESWDV